MCKCDKCGGNTCSFCGRGDCKGKSECLEAKVQRLEKKVKELEAKPAVVINPAPVYPVPYVPYQPCKVYPYWQDQTWIYCENSDPPGLGTGSVSISSSGFSIQS